MSTSSPTYTSETTTSTTTSTTTAPVTTTKARPKPKPPAVTTRKRVPVTTTHKPAPKKSNCDPNYTGACVPIASDVDCSSGNGNGPAYVVGPVTVVGSDIYDLDRDGDGVGCENG